MTHQDYVNLIRNGIPHPGGVWADAGCGSGAFTLALRDVAGSEATIFAIDKDKQALRSLEQNIDDQFPGTKIFFIHADFTKRMFLDDELIGIIAANSIHFTENTVETLMHLGSYLPSGGRLIVVEYNVDFGNTWVPFPFSFETLKKIVPQAGFAEPGLLGTIPSQFLSEIYAAILLKQ